MTNERVRGFLQLAATNAVSKVCWALSLIVLLRHLGPAQFGVLATLWSIATIAGGFVDLGTTQALVREGARAPLQARHLAAHALWLQLALTLASAAVLAAAAYRIAPDDVGDAAQRGLIVVLGIATPLIDRLQNLFTAYSQLGGSYAAFARTRSAYFVLLLAALVAAVLAGGGLVAVSATYFGLTAVFALLAGAGSWRGLPPSTQAASTRSVDLVRHGLPFLGIMVLTLAYGRVEVAVLGAWGHAAAAGAYHIIYNVILVVYSVSGIYFTVLYPRLYRHLDDHGAMRDDFRDTARWLSLLAWAAAPPILLFSAPLLALLGGAPLVAYVPLLRVLALLILLTPLSAALNFLLPMNRVHTRVACDALGIAITCGASVLAAALDQPLLAAAGAVLGYALALGVAHAVLARRLAGITTAALGELASAGARALLAALVAWLLPLPWWLACAAYLVVYAALLLLTAHPLRAALVRWFPRLAP